MENTLENDERAVFENSGGQEMGPKDLIVEVAHEGNCLFDGFLEGIWLAVDGAHVLHEANEGASDGFLEAFAFESEGVLELQVIDAFKKTLQYG